MEWQRIETAPKDGTPAILFSPYDEYINCEGGLIWVSGGYGRAVINPNSWRGESNKNPPTHWIPLPDPPQNILSPNLKPQSPNPIEDEAKTNG